MSAKAALLALDEVSRREDQQMLGSCLEGELYCVGKFADGSVVVCLQMFQYCESSMISDSFEEALSVLGAAVVHMR